MAETTSTDYHKLPQEDPKDNNNEAPAVVKQEQLPPKKKKSSCCCCCVKICLILFAVFFGLLLLAGACFYYHGREIVRKATVTTPKDLPIVEIPQAKLDEVTDRAMLFFDTIRAGDVPQDDLVVTAEELNGIYGSSDYLRGNIFSTLREGEIQTEFSLPTFFLPGGKDRFFVGKEVVDLDQQAHKVIYDLDIAAFPDSPLVLAVFNYLMSDNSSSKDEMEHLGVYLKSLQFLGETKAEGFIAKNYNLLEDFYNNPDNAEAAQVVLQLESIAIEDNRIVIKPRRGDDNAVTQAKESLKNFKNKIVTPILEKTMLRKQPAEEDVSP